jgi:hypothetical protein
MEEMVRDIRHGADRPDHGGLVKREAAAEVAGGPSDAIAMQRLSDADGHAVRHPEMVRPRF